RSTEAYTAWLMARGVRRTRPSGVLSQAVYAGDERARDEWMTRGPAAPAGAPGNPAPAPAARASADVVGRSSWAWVRPRGVKQRTNRVHGGGAARPRAKGGGAPNGGGR